MKDVFLRPSVAEGHGAGLDTGVVHFLTFASLRLCVSAFMSSFGTLKHGVN